jgi:hypothetical protein
MFGGHHIVGTTVGFTGDKRDFGHRCFSKGVKQLGAVLDDTVEFLVSSWHETWNIRKRDDRNLERIAEPHEACSLY